MIIAHCALEYFQFLLLRLGERDEWGHESPDVDEMKTVMWAEVTPCTATRAQMTTKLAILTTSFMDKLTRTCQHRQIGGRDELTPRKNQVDEEGSF